MSDLLTPLMPEYALEIPNQLSSMIGWVFWFLILVFVGYRAQRKPFKINRKFLLWFAGLSLLILFATPFLGFEIGLDMFGEINDRLFVNLMILAAVPMMVAGGVLGSFPAVLIGAVSGLLLAYLDSHHLFTPLVFMTMGLIFAWASQQRFRTLFFKLLRFPLLSAIFSLVFSLPAILVAHLLAQPGTPSERLSVAFALFPMDFFTLGGMTLVGSLICVLLRIIWHRSWGADAPFIPSPGERNTIYRWMSAVIPALLMILILATFTSWRVSERRIRRDLTSELIATADKTAESFMFFLEMGQNLIDEIAKDEALPLESPDEMVNYFDQKKVLISYFDKLAINEPRGDIIIVYPANRLADLDAFQNDADDLAFLSQSVNAFRYSIQQIGERVLIGFTTDIKRSDSKANTLLLGQTDLETNPYAKGFTDILAEFTSKFGVGRLITMDGSIIFPAESESAADLADEIFNMPTSVEKTSKGGEAFLQYFKPIADTNLGVIVSIPELKIHQMAWEETLPVVYIGLLVVVLVTGFLWLIWLPLRKDVLYLQLAVEQIAAGNFDVDLTRAHNTTIINQLSDSLKLMVGSLGKRFVNQSDLFTVAKNSAANPDLSSSLEIMMKAALAHGASAVRFVLPGDGDEKGFIEHRFGRGKHAHFFAPLDREILNHTQTHGETIIEDFQVGQTFNFVKGMPYPASLIALPLAIENKKLGVFYVTYQDKREVDQEEVRYFKGLAQKSSQVIAHASHLEKISQLKEQYGKVLDLVTDGVLLTDKDQTVIYANAACEKIFGLPTQSLVGEGVEKFMGKGMLEKISQKKADGSGIEEILLSDHRVYAVWHNRLHLNEKDDTKLFTLRDITAQKQRDAIKSEYVTTVSHELRSPLTLIQGYAKILRLTGNLHEQQNEYVNNIIDGVEDMKILVQNLLDIGRLEGGDPLDIAQVDAVELAQKAINSMAALAKQKNIELQMEAPQESLMIEADAQFLSLGLKNLLDNAIKYTKLRGEVTLSITEESDHVIFTVRDNGIGVSPLDQRHLFEKFNRVVTLQGEKQQGSGLGLAIVKSIAEHHCGKVWLESQLGKGSSFYLSIPKAGNSF